MSLTPKSKGGKKKRRFRSKISGNKGPVGLAALLSAGPGCSPRIGLGRPHNTKARSASSGEIMHYHKPKMKNRRKRPKKMKFKSQDLADLKRLPFDQPKITPAGKAKDPTPPTEVKLPLSPDNQMRQKPPPPSTPSVRRSRKSRGGPPPPPGYKFVNASAFPDAAGLPADKSLVNALEAARHFQSKDLFPQRKWNQGELKELKSKVTDMIKVKVVEDEKKENGKKEDEVKVKEVIKEGWSELLAPDGTGLKYYVNQKTGELTWIKPDCFKTKAELKTHEGDFYWIEDKNQGYIEAKKLKESKNSWKLERIDNNKTEDIPKAQLPLVPVVWESMALLERDMVMLPEMSRPIICWNLKERFKRNQIYTSIGSILISINPYKWLPLYTPTIMENYQKRRAQQGPHVYGIADDAFRYMRMHMKDQSIVISGESGAGKTECTKQALQYLAEVAGSGDSNIEQKILRANPLLEAYGNAKTVRNNNSSRFGKYVEIFFTGYGRICGASTTNYLLEKSRVVSCGEDERNYHIFFQMCRGMDDDQKKTLHLSDPKDFKYLSKGLTTVKGMDDAKEFEQVLDAMNQLHLSAQQISGILKITAAILHLGNVTFSEQTVKGIVTSSIVGGGKSVGIIAKLLDLEEKKLANGLTYRDIKSRGEVMHIPLSKADAEQVRDAVAKHVYSMLFDWIVVHVNQACSVDDEGQKKNSIGILDIFGFEIFRINSFEQLCINYTNEKLQQLFNLWTFKKEEELYAKEEIKFENVGYSDNQDVLDLIEKKRVGLMDMIDEEIRMPRGSDQSYMLKISKKHEKKKVFKQNKFNKMNFTVSHFAGDVEYSTQGFLFKNKDRLTEDIVDLLTHSNSALLMEIVSKASSSKETLGKKFKKQLFSLMKTLNNTEPHYIRCIKPNKLKAPLVFHGEMVLLQLQYSGVFEAVKIRKSGFPFRHTHGGFYRRYRCSLGRDYKWPEGDIKRCCRILLKHMRQEEGAEIGKFRILYRANEHRTMELYRNLAIENTCLYIQRVYRGHMARKRKNQLLAARPKFIAAMNTRTLVAIDKALTIADGLLNNQILEVDQVKAYKILLEDERRILESLKDLESKDPEKIFKEYRRLFEQAASLGYKVNMDEKTVDKDPTLIKWIHDCDARVADASERIKTRAMLREGTEKVDKLMINTAFKMGDYLSDKSRCSKFEFKFDPKDAKDAKAMLQSIAVEEELLEKLTNASGVGGFIKRGGIPALEPISSLIAEADKFGLRTNYGIDFLDKCKRIRALRASTRAALGTRDEALWVSARNSLAHAISAGELPPLSEVKGVEVKVPVKIALLKDYEEVKFTKIACDHHLKSLECEANLQAAIRAVIKLDLEDCIATAEELHERGPNDFTEKMYPALKEAHTLLKDINDCLKSLNEAVQKRDQAGIEAAHTRAERLHMLPDYFTDLQASKSMLESMLKCRERLKVTSENIWSPDGDRNIADAINIALELEFRHAPEIKDALELQAERSENDKLTENLHKEINRGAFLKEGDIVNLSGLDTSIDEAKKFELKTQAGKSALRMASNLRALRATLENAEETKDKEKWTAVETCISQAGSELAAYDEIRFAVERLTNQRSRDKVEEELATAIEEKHKSRVIELLEEAHKLEMDDKWYVKLYPVIKDAKSMLDVVKKHVDGLVASEAKRDQKALEKWIKESLSIGMAREFYPELPKAEDTLAQMIAAREALKHAHDTIFDDGGHDRIHKAIKTALDLAFEHAPELAAARRILKVLQIEEEVIEKLDKALDVGGFLGEGDVIDIKAIDKCFVDVKDIGGCRTNDGKDTEDRAKKIRQLRILISSTFGTKDKIKWREIEDHISGAGPILANHKEFQFAAKCVTDQKGRDGIKLKLIQAIEQRNQTDLTMWLKRAGELEMDTKYLSLYPEYTDAMGMLQTINGHVDGLRAAADAREEAKINMWLSKGQDLKLDPAIYAVIPDSEGVLRKMKDIRKDMRAKINDVFTATGGEELKKIVEETIEYNYAHVTEMPEAKSALKVRQEDDKITEILKRAIEDGGFVEDEGHDDIDTKTPVEALKNAEMFQMKTDAGQVAEKLCERVLALRIAIQDAEKTKVKENWKMVETKIKDTGVELSLHREITFAKTRIQRQRLRDEVEIKLEEAIANGHQANLVKWLGRGQELEMNTKWYIGLYPIYNLGEETLEKITTTTANLVKFELERDQNGIETNLKKAEALNMDDDMYSPIPVARATLSRLVKCREDLKVASEEIFAEHGHTKMDVTIQSAEDLKFMHAPEMKEAHRLLALRIQDEKHTEILMNLTKDKGFSNRCERAADYKVEFKQLSAAIEEAERFRMKTGPGKSVLLRAIVLRNLRQALNNAFNTKDTGLWAEVSKRSREAVIIRNSLANHPDVVGALEEYKLAKKMRELESHLHAAIEARDEKRLEETLVESQGYSMHDKYQDLFPVYKHATYALSRIKRINDTCREAQMKRTQDLFERAAADGEAYEFGKRAGTSEFKAILGLRLKVGQINLEAKDCVKMLEETHMEAVLTRARDLNITTENIEKIANFLENTSAEKFMQAQIRAAAALKDIGRKVEISIRLKKWYIEKYTEQFELQSYTRLRTKQGWANLKLLTMNREALAQSMLKFTTYPIHAALTETNAKSNNLAIKLFKNLMGFMGDRTYKNAVLLSQEICKEGLENEDIRDELFLHTIKQLTANPSPKSRERGWQHLSLLLHTFPPSGLDNFLDKWIMDNAKERKAKLLHILYATLYTGKRYSPLSDDETKNVMDGRSLKDFQTIQNDPKQSPVFKCYKCPLYTPPEWKAVLPKANKADIEWTDLEPNEPDPAQVGLPPDVKQIASATPIPIPDSSLPRGCSIPPEPEAEAPTMYKFKKHHVKASTYDELTPKPIKRRFYPDEKESKNKQIVDSANTMMPIAENVGVAPGEDSQKPNPPSDPNPRASISTKATPEAQAETNGPVWEELKSDQGEPYYWNTLTNEVVWEKPPDYDGLDLADHPIETADNGPLWEECRTETGEVYYWNTQTDETAWEKPAEM